jgi:hypothetical protein
VLVTLSQSVRSGCASCALRLAQTLESKDECTARVLFKQLQANRKIPNIHTVFGSEQMSNGTSRWLKKKGRPLDLSGKQAFEKRLHAKPVRDLARPGQAPDKYCSVFCRSAVEVYEITMLDRALHAVFGWGLELGDRIHTGAHASGPTTTL